MKEIELSSYGRLSVEPSPVNRMMAQFAGDFRCGIDINLGVGYINEKTIPLDPIEQALHEVIHQPERYQHALNYGDPKGSSNLIDSIRQYLLSRGIGGLDETTIGRNEIVIGPSGTTSLLDGIAQLLPAGIVITTDPMYYIYCNTLERLGFEIIAVPEDHHGIQIDLLKNKIEQLGEDVHRIRFFYVVTVNNPTCTILSNDRRAQLVDVVRSVSERLGRKVPLFLDKAYEDLIHDPTVETPQSALTYDSQGIVYELATLSKVIAPALRIGYMIGPDSNFLRAIIQKNSDIGFSAPLITQEIAGVLLDHHMDTQISRVNKGYREKALQVRRWIDDALGDHLADCRGGQAGFYYYLTFKSVETHEDSAFFKFLTRTTGRSEIDGPARHKHPRVIYIPGQYCVHTQGDLKEIGLRQLRLSYGYEELESIYEAICLMKQALEG